MRDLGRLASALAMLLAPLHFSVLHRYDVAEPDLDRRIDKRGAAVFPVPQGLLEKYGGRGKRKAPKTGIQK